MARVPIFRNLNLGLPSKVDPVRPSAPVSYHPPERKNPMEETNPTWKNHSFTLLIFGGIVALCSIFFVLGMLVGRNQGQKLAEIAFADEANRKPVAQNGGDEFPLDFYSQTTGENPDLKLKPAPPESAAPEASAWRASQFGFLGALRAVDRQARASGPRSSPRTPRQSQRRPRPNRQRRQRSRRQSRQKRRIRRLPSHEPLFPRTCSCRSRRPRTRNRRRKS